MGPEFHEYFANHLNVLKYQMLGDESHEITKEAEGLTFHVV